MKTLSLSKCTAKQLLNHLKNNHWTKETIIDGIAECVDESEENLKKITFLQLCENYQEEIAEFVYEEYANCQ